MMSPINTRDQAKARARALRAAYARRNQPISHAEALEFVAAECGFPDWNTAAAKLKREPEQPLRVGDRVQGSYLKQDFSGAVLALREMKRGKAVEVTIGFDRPVDVVTFPSFSNLRRRVTGTLSPSGVSFRRTGDGVPQLVVSNAGPPDG